MVCAPASERPKFLTLPSLIRSLIAPSIGHGTFARDAPLQARSRDAKTALSSRYR
jgi:hypothetical protein